MKVLSYTLLLVAIILHWWWLWLPAVVLVSFRYGAGGCIVLGFLLDGYFGHFYTVPALTLAAIAWYILVTVTQPRFVLSRSVVS